MALMAFSPRAATSQKEKSVNNHESNSLHHHPAKRLRLHEGHFDGFILSGRYINRKKF